jgi:hypothetical protein
MKQLSTETLQGLNLQGFQMLSNDIYRTLSPQCFQL